MSSTDANGSKYQTAEVSEDDPYSERQLWTQLAAYKWIAYKHEYTRNSLW